MAHSKIVLLHQYILSISTKSDITIVNLLLFQVTVLITCELSLSSRLVCITLHNETGQIETSYEKTLWSVHKSWIKIREEIVPSTQGLIQWSRNWGQLLPQNFDIKASGKIRLEEYLFWFELPWIASNYLCK